MNEQNEEIIGEFIAESTDAIDALEPLVVSLDAEKDNSETLHAIFRMVHSIKGTASFCDLPVLTDAAHAAENLLDGLRHKTLKVTRRRIDALCDVIDFLRFALTKLSEGEGESPYEERARELVVQVDGAVAELSAARRAAAGLVVENSESTAKERQPVPEMLPSLLDEGTIAPEPMPPRPQSPVLSAMPASLEMPRPGELDLGFMPELLEKFAAESEEHVAIIEQALLAIEQERAGAEEFSEAFRCMHSLKGNCGIVGLVDLEELTHVLETTLLGWNQGTAKPTREQVTMILSVLDVIRRTLAALPDGKGHVAEKRHLLELLATLAMAAPEKKQLKRPETASDRAHSPAAQEVLAEETRTVAAPSRAPKESPAREETKGAGGGDAAPERVSSSIRVDTRKLDELMNLVGELIIAETTVTHNPDLEGHEFENFQKAALNLNRITRMLQDVTMQARMVPIETTFRKMIRLVRDVANKQGKEVTLVTSGEETEVDKSVIETIGDPLVHLIRNAIDHGLEEPAERVRTGKGKVGQLVLEARHQGGEVWISISDDGRGIDPEKVLASALKKGVAEPSRSYSRQEILNFIFAPGFSTAAKLTDISGRGVGMDVVKRNVERVNGRIDIDTTVGSGTTFTLRIPLTLAIIEGMLVRVGDSYFTVPLLAVRESVKADVASVVPTNDGRKLLRLREALYPMVSLVECFGYEGSKSGESIQIIVESNSGTVCISVDEVVGQRQTVIKPIPDYLKGVPMLSGCSILPNGEISLILDTDVLVRNFEGMSAA